MKKFFALVAAIFIAALSFAYPITVHAEFQKTVPTTTHISDLTNFSYTDDDYYFSWDIRNGYNHTRTFAFKWQKTQDISNYLTINGNTLYFDLPTIITRISYADYEPSSTPTYTGNIGYKMYFDFDNNQAIWYKADGSGSYGNYYTGELLAFNTNYPFPADLDLTFSFAPAMNGSVSRTQAINGHNYTSDTLDLTVTNNGLPAQWAMFIVPNGESITIPALQWDNSKIWTGPSIFTYVKDEWCFDHFEPVGSFDVDTTTFMPSAVHYISSNDSNSYSINWSSMKLQANTTYDVVCYAALNDRGDSAVSFSNTLTYSEVYRSTFTMSDPAAFNPDNSGDGGYSWDNDTDNSSLLSMKKATQDNFGNFYVNYPDNSYTSINASVNTDVAFGSFFRFFRQILSFFPPSWITIITIGLSSIVAIGIIKAVSK